MGGFGTLELGLDFGSVGATAPPAPDPVDLAVTFADNFAGTDGQLLRNRTGWAAYNVSGSTANTRDSWRITGARAVKTVTDYTAPGVHLIAHDAGSVDQYFEVTVSGQPLDLGLAGSTNNQRLRVQFLNAGALLVQKIEAGAETNLASAVYSNWQVSNLVAGDRFGLLLRGTKLRLFKNGVMLANSDGIPYEADIGGFAKGTLAGMSSYEWGDPADWWVDDVLIQGLTSDTLTLTTPPLFVVADVAWDDALAMDLPVDSQLTLSGNYTGLQPSHIDYRLRAFPSGVVVQDWQPATNATIGGGTWQATASIPPGGPYRVEVRKRNNTSCWTQAATQISCGPAVAGYGQSYMGGRVESGSVTSDSRIFYHRSNIDTGIEPGWMLAANSNIGPLLTKLADMYSAKMGRTIPAAFVGAGKAGVGITALHPTLGTPNEDKFTGGGATATYWQQLTGILTRANAIGKVAAFLWDHGAGNELNAAGWNAYPDKLDTIISRARSDFAGGRNIPAFTTIVSRYDDTVIPAGTSNESWTALRRANFRQQFVTANTFVGNHVVGVQHGDPYHLANTLAGNGESNRRAGLTMAKVLGGTAYDGRGPRATTATRSGAVITIPVALSGAASIAASGGLTGFRVATDVDLTTPLAISSAVLSGSNIIVTLAADPGGRVYVGNYWGANPDAPNKAGAVWAIGTYADATTIPMEPIVDPIRTAT
ncbi:hypothetical protein [Sphingomonas sp. KC8]|uniref:hypothetical protein n=1 Tax=Sphingomonas sp. KC8 TaxID=1030157 RepID=UPI000248A7C8|nr:hypothetical protein [Sphingomonas sp. KC8]ARS27602.1 hypothetical protein KC8_09890 [Sphingomonas sp. KC8]